MLTCFLQRVLPFTLTLIIGAALGGFFNPFGARREVSRIMRTELHDYSNSKGRACKQRRFKRHELVAETKPLIILFKPDARWPRGLETGKEGVSPALVRVTFGADSKVQEVEPLDNWSRILRDSDMKGAWKAVERAARQIQFEPETINSLPVSVTKEVEIRFMWD